jgi:hypothetical protein
MLEKASRMKLIDEKAIPGRIKKKAGEWLELLKSIPKGKAWVITEEEAGVKATSIKTMVNRLIDIGELPSNYKAIQRTKGGKVTIYVINSAEGTEDKTEGKLRRKPPEERLQKVELAEES